MKRAITRRELGIVVAVTTAVANAQTPGTTDAQDLLKGARDLNARIAETLAKFKIPISTEPAFQFKA